MTEPNKNADEKGGARALPDEAPWGWTWFDDSAVRAVSALHRRTETPEGFVVLTCVECMKDWPCPTLMAVAEASTDGR